MGWRDQQWAQHLETEADESVRRHAAQLHEVEMEALVDRSPETGRRPRLFDRVRLLFRRTRRE